MHTAKFNLPHPTFIKWLNTLMAITSLCALWLWRAPLSERLWMMGVVVLLSLGHAFWLIKVESKRYPAILSFKEDNWYLNEHKVTIETSTMLTPYCAALCLKDARKKTYRLIATQRSFLELKYYHDFIRFLKTHRGSF